MSSVRYYNASAPFWNWVAEVEERGAPRTQPGNHQDPAHQGGPESAWGMGPFGPWGHHGGPAPAPEAEAGPSNTQQSGGEATNEKEGEPEPTPDHPGREHHRRHHGGCGRRGRGFGRGGFRGFGFGPHGMGGGPRQFPWGFGGLGDFFNGQQEEGEQQDFKPDVDVFDTESSFVVHVSLPGANKEDVGVNWDAEKSELSIAGVIYRPGDEEFLKTLAMNERKIGPFERKVRLGSPAHPAQVDSDLISAKLEDGVLRIDVPKLDKDYVEVKKVDIL